MKKDGRKCLSSQRWFAKSAMPRSAAPIEASTTSVVRRAAGRRARRPSYSVDVTGVQRSEDMLLSRPRVLMSPLARTARVDRMLLPVHRWVWSDFDRRVRKLLAFAEVESDGGRDILRAAEVTPDALLRRLYLEHAIDELHHGDLFRQRGAALLRTRSSRLNTLFNGTPLPGGHGLAVFPQGGGALLRPRSSRLNPLFNGPAVPGGHGLDDLSVKDEPDHRLLAFL